MVELKEMDDDARREVVESAMEDLSDYFEQRAGWTIRRWDTQHSSQAANIITFSSPDGKARSIRIELRNQRVRRYDTLDPTIYVRANKYHFNEGFGDRTAHFKLRSDGTFNVNGIIERALEWADELRMIHEQRQKREEKRRERERETDERRQRNLDRVHEALEDPEEIHELKPEDGTSYSVHLGEGVWVTVNCDEETLWISQLKFEHELTPEQVLEAAHDLWKHVPAQDD